MDAFRVIASGVVLGLLAYVCGSTPWGFLIGKFNGLDLRKHGSGNIGATNVRRVLGRDWGILCFVLDFLKGLVPVLVCAWLGARLPIGGEGGGLIAAAAAVSGHVWPFWLRFRGGKGVATTIGALLAVAPFSVIICIITWLVIFYALRYVSLASLAAAIVLPLSHVVLAWSCAQMTFRLPTFLLLLTLAVLIIVRHHSNLKRLIQGTEYRFPRSRTESRPSDDDNDQEAS